MYSEKMHKKKEEIFVEFKVLTEDTEDLLSLEGRKFIDKKSMNANGRLEDTGNLLLEGKMLQ